MVSVIGRIVHPTLPPLCGGWTPGPAGTPDVNVWGTRGPGPNGSQHTRKGHESLGALGFFGGGR